jgi:hypothetical protein
MNKSLVLGEKIARIVFYLRGEKGLLDSDRRR